MNETNATPTADREKVWKRRGLFAAAAALVAAVVGKVTEQKAEAGVDGDVVLGADNTTAGLTTITCTSTGNNLVGATAVRASCLTGAQGQGRGLEGEGSQYGVYGYTNSQTRNDTAGVYGTNNVASGYGVWGSNPTGVGVRGDASSGMGILGIGGDVGIYGLIPSTAAHFAVGIYGNNNSPYPGAGSQIGGFGVYGLSGNGHGVVGATAGIGAAAVVGATNGVAGAYGGVFYGPVVVQGNFTVAGGAKSAAVPHPDGSHRRLYCVESPESWFEDFGKGQLKGGCADVVIDPDFAAVVDLTDYHVFLTQYGGHDDLSVVSHTPSGFRVEAVTASSASRFSWRIVAKRKDIAARRFEEVTVPPEPALPTIPETLPSPLTRSFTAHR